MTVLQHCLLTLHGEWANGNWVGETGQMGIRFTLESVVGTPGRGTVYTPNDLLGDVTADSGTASGTNGTLTRMWKCRVGGEGSPWNLAATEQIDICEAARAYAAALHYYQPSAWHWTHAKLHAVAASGLAPEVDGSPVGAATYTFTTPVQGSESLAMPPEVALSMSLRAPISGRRGRGRMYLPACANNLNDGTGQLAYTPTAPLLSALTSYVSGIENMTGWTAWQPVVCVTSPGKATAVRPTEARVGNHFDVQRRRQAQVREIYTAASLS